MSVAYRLGASVLVRELRSWADNWLGHRALGGVRRRSRDAFLRLVETVDAEDNVYVSQEVTKFFRQGGHLLLLLEHLAAPVCLRDFVRAMLHDHRRVFSMGGRLGAKYHQVTRGLAQGDPLSTLLAAAVMVVWSWTVVKSEAEAMSFVDDRAFWSSSETHLQVAKVQSDLFDRTFNFRCDVAISVMWLPLAVTWVLALLSNLATTTKTS